MDLRVDLNMNTKTLQRLKGQEYMLTYEVQPTYNSDNR